MSIPDTYTNLASYLGQALPMLRRTQVQNLGLWV